MPKTRKYEEWLIESLKDHDAAVAYLNAALEESLKGDAESQEVLLMALRAVTCAILVSIFSSCALLIDRQMSVEMPSNRNPSEPRMETWKMEQATPATAATKDKKMVAVFLSQQKLDATTVVIGLVTMDILFVL